MSKQTPLAVPFRTAYSRQIALWTLRMMSRSLARNSFVQVSESRGVDYQDDDVARFLELPQQVEAAQAGQVHELMDLLEKFLSLTPKPVGLGRRPTSNLQRFANDLNLTPCETGILSFFVALKVESLLCDAYRVAENCAQRDLVRFLSTVLAEPRAEVARALEPGGRLRTCQLLTDRVAHRGMGGLMFCSSRVAAHLFHDRYDRTFLLREFGVEVPDQPELNLSDYGHLGQSLTLLRTHLSSVLSEQKSGCNILLHGVPGTGKTQLTRVLAREFRVPGREIAVSSRRREPIAPLDRLSKLDFAEAFLSNQRCCLVFDEAEDIFSSSLFERSIVDTHKGWFNGMLGRNRFPVFWISNSIRSLDPAFCRRFDLILEVTVPPEKQRRVIFEKLTGDLVAHETISRLANADFVAPAVVAKAAEVLRGTAKDCSGSERDSLFSHMVTQTLKAQGHPDPFRNTGSSPKEFDPEFLNTDLDLTTIAEQLGPDQGARICLYGPPGTGKTSFGHWLAGRLERPLKLKAASDLLSPYHGETESRIARAFEEAEREGAILQIDEVDSFLRERGEFRHSWEVSQVNQMLTNLDSFSGILIVTTNRLESMDEASLRRFDLKLQFDYLRPEQTSRLFQRFCEERALDNPGPEILSTVENLTCCTPGDFAVLARRHRFRPWTGTEELVAELFREVEIKTDRSRRIGFG